MSGVGGRAELPGSGCALGLKGSTWCPGNAQFVLGLFFRESGAKNQVLLNLVTCYLEASFPYQHTLLPQLLHHLRFHRLISKQHSLPLFHLFRGQAVEAGQFFRPRKSRQFIVVVLEPRQPSVGVTLSVERNGKTNWQGLGSRV